MARVEHRFGTNGDVVEAFFGILREASTRDASIYGRFGHLMAAMTRDPQKLVEYKKAVSALNNAERTRPEPEVGEDIEWNMPLAAMVQPRFWHQADEARQGLQVTISTIQHLDMLDPQDIRILLGPAIGVNLVKY